MLAQWLYFHLSLGDNLDTAFREAQVAIASAYDRGQLPPIDADRQDALRPGYGRMRADKLVRIGKPTASLPVGTLGTKAADPLFSLSEPTNNLPHPDDVFVGRWQELVRIGDWLDGGQVHAIALTGASGVGTSSLAIRAAFRNSWRYLGGVVHWNARDYVERNPNLWDPATKHNLLDDLCQKIAACLNPKPDFDEKAVQATKEEWLRRCLVQPMLLVLDNLSSLLGKRSSLRADDLRDFLQTLLGAAGEHGDANMLLVLHDDAQTDTILNACGILSRLRVELPDSRELLYELLRPGINDPVVWDKIPVTAAGTMCPSLRRELTRLQGKTHVPLEYVHALDRLARAAPYKKIDDLGSVAASLRKPGSTYLGVLRDTAVSHLGDCRVLTVMGVMGGVGKSTVAFCAAQLIADEGREVAVIDFDLTGAGLSNWYAASNNVRPQPDVMTVYDHIAGFSSGFDSHVAVDGKSLWDVTPEYLGAVAGAQRQRGKIWLLPSIDVANPEKARRCTRTDQVVSNVPPATRQLDLLCAMAQMFRRIRDQLPKVCCVIVDCGAGSSTLCWSAFACAQYRFLITSPGPASEKQAAGLLPQYRSVYPNPDWWGVDIIVNRTTRSSVVVADTGGAKAELNQPVGSIPLNARFGHHFMAGQWIDYDVFSAVRDCLKVSLKDKPELVPRKIRLERSWLWWLCRRLLKQYALLCCVLAMVPVAVVLTVIICRCTSQSTAPPDSELRDVAPQFAVVRVTPYPSLGHGATLDSKFCSDPQCAPRRYGLSLAYHTPTNWSSYNFDYGLDVSSATYLEFWMKGVHGDERFQIVLWSNCRAVFPYLPPKANNIKATTRWQQWRIPLSDYKGHVNLASLCRLSVGFNDAMSKGGTIYLSQIAFVDAKGQQVPVVFRPPIATARPTATVQASPTASTTAQATATSQATATAITEPPVSAAPQPAFSESTTVSPSNVAAHGEVTIQTTLTNSGRALSNCIVDIEVWTKDGKRVAQRLFEHQTLQAAESQTFDASWTPSSPGTYYVRMGVVGPKRAPQYFWDSGAATITVT